MRIQKPLKRSYTPGEYKTTSKTMIVPPFQQHKTEKKCPTSFLSCGRKEVECTCNERVRGILPLRLVSSYLNLSTDRNSMLGCEPLRIKAVIWCSTRIYSTKTRHEVEPQFCGLLTVQEAQYGLHIPGSAPEYLQANLQLKGSVHKPREDISRYGLNGLQIL